MPRDHEMDDETSPGVLRDLARGGAFLGGPGRDDYPPVTRPSQQRGMRTNRPTSYDADARFRADILYGRNRDQQSGPGRQAPPPATDGSYRRALPDRPGTYPAPAPRRRRRARGRREEAQAPGYWFLKDEKARPPLRSAAERDAEERAARKVREEDARVEAFVTSFQADHPGASRGDALTAWDAARRAANLDLG